MDQIEGAPGREALLFHIAVSLLHEYVHYGDDQDGIDYDGKIGEGEEGAVFEIEAYGKVIELEDAVKMINKYRADQERQKRMRNIRRRQLDLTTY